MHEEDEARFRKLTQKRNIRATLFFCVGAVAGYATLTITNLLYDRYGAGWVYLLDAVLGLIIMFGITNGLIDWTDKRDFEKAKRAREAATITKTDANNATSEAPPTVTRFV